MESFEPDEFEDELELADILNENKTEDCLFQTLL